MTVQVIESLKPPEPDLLRDCPPGEVRPIIFWPDARLGLSCDEVPPQYFGADLNKLVSDLVTTMYMTGGIGLSAPQIGVPLRVFVADIFHQQGLKGPNQLLVVVNPMVEGFPDGEQVAHQEGCLSFPGVQEVVSRPPQAVIRGRTRRDEGFLLKVGGVLARVVQHEMDHLHGMTFLDCMNPLAKRSAIKAVNRFHAGVRSDEVRVSRPPRSRRQMGMKRRTAVGRRR